MNKSILNSEVQDFIDQNLSTEITRLILKGSPFDRISIQELASQIEAKKKSKTKLKTWFDNDGIYFPSKLNIEQTSSEITAKYKSELLTGKSLIDITGGFGVDAFYFSKTFNKVTHCEINEALSEIVTYNFKSLGVSNIKTIPVNGFDYLKNTSEKFDCIYIDPSRRNDVKGKVFLLKDCLPYIPPKIDFFFSKANAILVKLSPMLDITNTARELKTVKEVHIVAVNNEVKELLFLLVKDFEGDVTIKTINFNKSNTQTFNFKASENRNAQFDLPQQYLYEPNAAILKSGGFNEITKQFEVSKLHQHSHLYTSENLVEFPGRIFKINAVTFYDKKKLKKLLPQKKANITTRNFPKNVAQIRKETKIKDGGTNYLFFTTNRKNKHTVLICNKL